MEFCAVEDERLPAFYSRRFATLCEVEKVAFFGVGELRGLFKIQYYVVHETVRLSRRIE